MTSSEFKVFFQRKETLIGILGLFAIFAFFVYAIFASPVNRTQTIVVALLFFILIVFATLAATLFCVKVNGSEIAVRTRLGRHYKFNCSDINEVTISYRTGRYGPQYRILISTETKTLDLEWTMINFEIMAGYILEKYKSGEIMKPAISPYGKRDLLRLSKKRGAYVVETPNV